MRTFMVRLKREDAAQIIAERFGDKELHAVEAVMAIWFMRRMPVVHPPG
ncbi:MAG: hypothetical protein DDT32_02201 [Syntrophomonadaceae bacterium]|nr:hypothetical protein [Bacillota bacterium]